MSARYWKTKAGVLVEERAREVHAQFGGKITVKIFGFRVPSGGAHGWLNLKTLTPAKGPKSPSIAWENRLAVAFVGRIRFTLTFEPRKLNGHRATHPWILSIDGMKFLKRGPQLAGCYRRSGFQTELEARQYGAKWLRDRGAA